MMNVIFLLKMTPSVFSKKKTLRQACASQRLFLKQPKMAMII